MDPIYGTNVNVTNTGKHTILILIPGLLLQTTQVKPSLLDPLNYKDYFSRLIDSTTCITSNKVINTT